MPWSDENYLDEFAKKYNLEDAFRYMAMQEIRHLRNELNAEILTSRSFLHNQTWFTYYLN